MNYVLTERGSRSFGGHRAIIIAGVFVAGFLFAALCMDRTINVFDEGFVLHDAQRVLDGDIPHRDFYTNYGPGQPYVLAVLFRLLGASVLVERLWDTIVRAFIVTLVFIIVDRAAPRRVALLAAAAAMVWVAYPRQYGYPLYPSLAASLADIALLAPALARQPLPAANILAAGACAGVAALFRYDMGIAVFGATCAVLAYRAWLGRTNMVRSTCRLIGLYSTGFALVTFPVLVFLGFAGALSDAVLQVVIFLSRYYVKTRALPFPRPWDRRREMDEFSVYLPILVGFAAVPVLIAQMRDRLNIGYVPRSRHVVARGDVLPWTILLLTVATLLFFNKGVIRVNVISMAAALVTTAALSSVLLVGKQLVGRVGYGLILLSGLTVFTFTLRVLAIDLELAHLNIGWARDPESWRTATLDTVPKLGTCRMPSGLERMDCFRLPTGTAAAIQFVRLHTEPQDPIYVGLTRHDRAYGSDVAFYFIANRPSATKWAQFDPWLQSSAPTQQEMVRELRAARPKVIVLVSTWDDVREANDSAISSGVTILDDYIKNTFTSAATFGPDAVLLARPTR
jgi:hypothetical protein